MYILLDPAYLLCSTSFYATRMARSFTLLVAFSVFHVVFVAAGFNSSGPCIGMAVLDHCMFVVDRTLIM